MNMSSLGRSTIFLAFMVVFAGSSTVSTRAADGNEIVFRTVEELLSRSGIPTSGWSVLIGLVLDPPPVSPKPKHELDLTQSNPQLESKTGAELGDDVSKLSHAIEFAKTLPRSEDNENAIATMSKMQDLAKAEIEQRQKENIPPAYSIEQLRTHRNEQMQEAAKRHWAVPLPAPLPHPGPNPPDPGPGPNPIHVDPGGCSVSDPNNLTCTAVVH